MIREEDTATIAHAFPEREWLNAVLAHPHREDRGEQASVLYWKRFCSPGYTMRFTGASRCANSKRLKHVRKEGTGDVIGFRLCDAD